MFRRNIISKLEAWKQDKKHKPIILRGARQVGKTTVVNEFGSQFDNYLYFNLERTENAKLFEMEIPLDDLVNMLYASVGKVKKEGTTLVFIDEILAHNSKLYPIEVKSGTNAHLRSLQVFMDSSEVNIAIRIWSKPYSVDQVKTIHGKEFTLINLPFYLIGNLRSVLDEVDGCPWLGW